jgi:hypothetical protein
MQPSGSPSEAPSSTPTTSTPTDSPTSAPTNAPTSQPSNSPTSQPTSAPTNSPTSQLSSSPTVTEDRWTTCGTFFGDGDLCNGITAGFTDPTLTQISGADIAVRCCADEPTAEFRRSSRAIIAGCPYAASRFGGICYEGNTFRETEDICTVTMGGRLCTKEEMEGGCTAGTGCDFELSNVWTSSTP